MRRIGEILLAAALLALFLPHWARSDDPLFSLTLGDEASDQDIARIPSDPACVRSSVFFGNGGQNLDCSGNPAELNGRYNLGAGQRALTNITSGKYNVVGGYEAGENFLTAKYQTCWGEACMIYHQHDQKNTCAGWKCMLGRSSMAAPFGDFNSGAGAGFMINAANAYRNSGAGNYALGGPNMQGDGNAVLGNAAGVNCENCNENVFINSNGVPNGNYNVIIGPVAGLPATMSHTIVIADGQGNVRIKCEPATCKFYASGGTLIGQMP